MKIVCISDIHYKYDNTVIPEGDLLIIAGDVTMFGERVEWERFKTWAIKLKFPKIFFVFGNHDFISIDPNIPKELETLGLTVLTDKAEEWGGIKFYGSPWQKDLHRWAWHKDESEIVETWNDIPDDVEVLITHVPPYNILDSIPPFSKYGNGNYAHHVGDDHLLERVRELKKLKLHVFGHIHESHGTWKSVSGGPTFCNASICDDNYNHTYKPIVINYEDL